MRSPCRRCVYVSAFNFFVIYAVRVDQKKLGDCFFPKLLFISVIPQNLGQEPFILKFLVVFLSPS
jgi:hypothetical protein